ncbi:MAG: hypothetical protein U9O83_01530 [Campylobacterota bacterium]|nr:hypothetical protein [Campylobacterota bacterium]
MRNSMKKIITLSLAVGVTTALIAKPNIDNSGMKENIAKMAGEKGMFVKHEAFPKDYFLISKSLPFAVGLTLHHPRSSELGLSKEQLEKIQKIKGDTIPVVIESAKKIKKLELALSKRMMDGAKAEDEHKAVYEIASKKAELTNHHIRCIEKVRAILTPKQRKILLSYAGAKMQKGQKHPIEELVELPHPAKLVIMNDKALKITDEQMQKIDSTMLAVYPPLIHGNMDKAEIIEKKIKKEVMRNRATKESLKDEIQSLVDIKVQITNDHIDALNMLQSILTKSQYAELVKMIKNKKHHH